MRARAPFRFVATNNRAFDSDPAELRMEATIRSLSRSTRHGEPDSRYLSLEIVEFRSAATERRSRTKSDKFPLKHKLDKNDTLRSLAKHYWKNKGADWILIKSANGGAQGRLKGVGPNETIVKAGRYKVGDRITIPETISTGDVTSKTISSPDSGSIGRGPGVSVVDF